MHKKLSQKKKYLLVAIQSSNCSNFVKKSLKEMKTRYQELVSFFFLFGPHIQPLLSSHVPRLKIQFFVLKFDKLHTITKSSCSKCFQLKRSINACQLHVNYSHGGGIAVKNKTALGCIEYKANRRNKNFKKCKKRFCTKIVGCSQSH